MATWPSGGVLLLGLLLPVLAQLAQEPPQQQQEDMRCVSPSGQESACVRLSACRPLLDLLRQGRDRPLHAAHAAQAKPPAVPEVHFRGSGPGRTGLPDPEATAILRKSHCGFEGSTVMVCCPPDDLQTLPRAKPSGPGEDRLDEVSVSFSGPSAYPGHYGPSSSSSSASTPSPPSTPESSNGMQAHPEYESAYAPLAASAFQAPPTPVTLDSKNLALLPMEVCGLFAQSEDQPARANRTALLQYPWMARLGYRQAGGTVEYFCSGSLISERYVLTAAHCVKVQGGPTFVRVGEQDSETDPDCSESMCAPNVIDVDIEETVVHESYKRGVNDIALIRMTKPVTFTEAVSPVCLPIPTQDNPAQSVVGKSFTVTGWGKSTPNRRLHAPNRWLLQTHVSVSDGGFCSAAYSDADDVDYALDAHLCVGGHGQSSCQGDSGSPLVLSETRRGPGPGQRTVQHGLLSYGLADCVLRAAPVVYTRVAHFLPWIVDHLQPAPFVPKDVTSGSGYVDPRRAGR